MTVTALNYKAEVFVPANGGSAAPGRAEFTEQLEASKNVLEKVKQRFNEMSAAEIIHKGFLRYEEEGGKIISYDEHRVLTRDVKNLDGNVEEKGDATKLKEFLTPRILKHVEEKIKKVEVDQIKPEHLRWMTNESVSGLKLTLRQVQAINGVFPCDSCNCFQHTVQQCPKKNNILFIRCTNCNEAGHRKNQCPPGVKKRCMCCGATGLDVNIGEHTTKTCPSFECKNCREKGHFSNKCPKKGEGGKCFLCGESGHKQKDCNRRRELRTCHYCHQKGHMKKECPNFAQDNAEYWNPPQPGGGWGRQNYQRQHDEQAELWTRGQPFRLIEMSNRQEEVKTDDHYEIEQFTPLTANGRQTTQRWTPHSLDSNPNKSVNQFLEVGEQGMKMNLGPMDRSKTRQYFSQDADAEVEDDIEFPRLAMGPSSRFKTKAWHQQTSSEYGDPFDQDVLLHQAQPQTPCHGSLDDPVDGGRDPMKTKAFQGDIDEFDSFGLHEHEAEENFPSKTRPFQGDISLFGHQEADGPPGLPRSSNVGMTGNEFHMPASRAPVDGNLRKKCCDEPKVLVCTKCSERDKSLYLLDFQKFGPGGVVKESGEKIKFCCDCGGETEKVWKKVCPNPKCLGGLQANGEKLIPKCGKCQADILMHPYRFCNSCQTKNLH